MLPRHSSHKLVTSVVLGDHDEAGILALAASLALAAGHPLGAAIYNRSDEPEVNLPYVDKCQMLEFNGVAGLINGHAVVLGSSMLFAKIGIAVGDFGDWSERFAEQGQSVTIIAVDGNVAGFFGTQCV
jgi:cation transport ATPase